MTATNHQLQLAAASGLLVISQTHSLIVLVQQTNFSFYKIFIQLEIAELPIASYSQLQLVVAIGLLVISETPTLLAEWTNFPIYSVLIQLEIAYELLKCLKYDQNRNIIASHGIFVRLAGGKDYLFVTYSYLFKAIICLPQ